MDHWLIIGNHEQRLKTGAGNGLARPQLVIINQGPVITWFMCVCVSLAWPVFKLVNGHRFCW